MSEDAERADAGEAEPRRAEGGEPAGDLRSAAHQPDPHEISQRPALPLRKSRPSKSKKVTADFTFAVMDAAGSCHDADDELIQAHPDVATLLEKARALEPLRARNTNNLFKGYVTVNSAKCYTRFAIDRLPED